MTTDIVISVENLSKSYHLGQIGTGTLTNDLKIWWAKAHGKTNPLLRIDQEDYGNRDGDRVWALRNVNFQVKRGEVLGIIGRNGAGKSTLLKILSRVTAPSSGGVKIKGRVASLLEVGTGFHPELTGRENIYLNGAILGMSRDEVKRKFDEIISFAEIEKFIDTPVKRYSSGMYVRLAFAVAAHLEPEILILDEVLAVGDAAFQKKCLGKISEVAKIGRTVLFVSHNLSAVANLCEKAMIIKQGTVENYGDSKSIVKQYISSNIDPQIDRTWSVSEAPGDDKVRLVGINLTQEGKVTGIVNINKDFEINLKYLILQKCQNLITGVSIYSTIGDCVFNSCDWRPNDHITGIYSKRIKIKSPLLQDDIYSVLAQLVFFEPDIKSIVLKEALWFKGFEQDDRFNIHGSYQREWPGIVRVLPNWEEAILISTNFA